MPLHKITGKLLAHEQRYWKKFYDEFCRFLYQDKQHCDAFVASTFKILKSIFNWLRVEKAIPVGDFHRLFRIPVQQPTPFVLLPDQLHFLIFDEQFHNQLPPHLRRTKDLFVFGCTTGLRVSDLMQLRQKNLVVYTGRNYLNIYTQKTCTNVLIPLPDYCMQILKKYKGRCGGYLLPRLSNTNINKQVKAIGKAASWTADLPKYRTRKGKMIELKNKNGGCWKMYQHITSHTMRRTAITTLLMMGVDEAIVRRVSGHAPGSKEFYRYIALAQSYMDQQIHIAHQRLATNPNWYLQ